MDTKYVASKPLMNFDIQLGHNDILLRLYFTVLEPACLKSLIDVLICKLHYGFGGIRHLTLPRQVHFSLNYNNLYVQKLARMRMID